MIAPLDPFRRLHTIALTRKNTLITIARHFA